MFSTIWSTRARRTGITLICLLTLAVTRPGRSRASATGDKLDRALRSKADRATGTSRVIVVLKPGTDPTDGRRFGGVMRRRLGLIDGAVVDLPNAHAAPARRRARRSRASTRTGRSSPT